MTDDAFFRDCEFCHNATPRIIYPCVHCRKWPSHVQKTDSFRAPLIEFDDKPCAIQRALIKLGPWHMLVGCILLNLTSRVQVKKVLPTLFELVPKADALEYVDDDALIDLLTPLGLVNRRVKAICELTEDWLNDLPVDELRHCGPYAQDSYKIFVEKERIPIRPDMDSELRRYLYSL